MTAEQRDRSARPRVSLARGGGEARPDPLAPYLALYPEEKAGGALMAWLDGRAAFAIDASTSGPSPPRRRPSRHDAGRALEPC